MCSPSLSWPVWVSVRTRLPALLLSVPGCMNGALVAEMVSWFLKAGRRQ